MTFDPKEALSPEEARRSLGEADLLYTPAQVDAALDRMAHGVAEDLSELNPLVLVVMIGGLFPAVKLLERLDFPLEVDYIHATRYRGGVRGGELQWRARPTHALHERTVLVVDDILDEGTTLAAVVADCVQKGARKVYTAVLTDKQHPRERSLERADFTGLPLPDRYVFGSGMDYKGFHRNVPGIYAVKGL